ncbi:TIGR01777 family protein [Mucilaginibacter pallidiroseus]|uniref:TIGR01777 family protein n=1 Tax=Mucilaginibacter pallidiroseus TaxID=2599295 RepID=A0A563U7P4_9SPHI|nr:TIGR01777 family oxidoreductase [Mucilaginibacter pallidiroseus]TWR27392.1 TIGR01777 family protein [Mucilaginibacter pallidiroseus]
MSKSVLITGGSGLLGKELTNALLKKDYIVSHLSRSKGNTPGVKTFLWNVPKGEIDANCLNGVDTIVHLAGAGIADERWTVKRKKEIIDSRTQSIGLLYRLMRQKPNQVKTVISASGIGYYSDRGDEILAEDATPAHDFMGKCCVAWEKAVDSGKDFGVRIVKYRTGVVLTKDGGALPKLALPVKLAVGSPLGSGRQWVSWIHHHDVLNMYLDGIANQSISGVYNMAAPCPVTNATLTAAVARQLKRPLWAPKVPAFLIKTLFGEMATVVLGSTRTSAQKIEDTGFKFTYPDIAAALKEIYG